MFKVLKEDSKEKDVFFKLFEDEGDIDLYTVTPEGAAEYYILSIKRDGTLIRSEICADIGLVLDEEGKIKLEE
jgi:hypothetical protein